MYEQGFLYIQQYIVNCFAIFPYFSINLMLFSVVIIAEMNVCVT